MRKEERGIIQGGPAALGGILTTAGHHCTELPSMEAIVLVEKFCPGHFLPAVGMEH